MTAVVAWPWLSAAGAVVGLLFGLFGVGGSSFATPLLSLLGIPGLMAVASLLPATIPAALAGANAYGRTGKIDWITSRRSVLGGLPATIAGALLSNVCWAAQRCWWPPEWSSASSACGCCAR